MKTMDHIRSMDVRNLLLNKLFLMFRLHIFRFIDLFFRMFDLDTRTIDLLTLPFDLYILV